MTRSSWWIFLGELLALAIAAAERTRRSAGQSCWTHAGMADDWAEERKGGTEWQEGRRKAKDERHHHQNKVP